MLILLQSNCQPLLSLLQISLPTLANRIVNLIANHCRNILLQAIQIKTKGYFPAVVKLVALYMQQQQHDSQHYCQ